MAAYREALRTMPAPWEPYLREHSGLPGPRANLELMQAVADEARWMLRRNLTKARMRQADPQRRQELEQRLAV